ncbi:MAG: ABC transporter substrate-binding protein [Lachnospiraceae bacterium]
MKKLLVLFLAMTIILSLAACEGKKPGGEDAAGKADADGNGRIDKVYMAVSSDPTNLLPWDSKGNSRKIIYTAIYDTLFDFINGEYVPNVATGYEEIDDLHWEVKINDNVKDWEGNALKASDIVHCYTNYVDSGFAVKFNNFVSVEAKDDTTLLFTWANKNTGVAALDHVLCNVQLYTEAAWDAEKFATAPVATGPYKLVEYVGGSKVVVEVNEDYWNANPTEMRKQNVDVIEYSIVTEAAQNVIGLKEGSLDISSNIPAEDFENFAADEKFFTASVPTNEIYVLSVNCQTIPDANMRKALFYAIDSEALSTTVTGSTATKAYGSPASPDYVKAWEDIETFYNTYDVDKAKELLGQSDYKGENLHITCAGDENIKNIATMIQVFWEQIGVKSDIETVDRATANAYNTDPTKWDINVGTAGGSFLVNSMNRLYNTSDFGGEYSNGFVVDEKLWELFGKANNVDTWGEDTLTAMFEYVADMGYHYVMMYMNASAVATNDITGFYYWDSVILPQCCTYNLG